MENEAEYAARELDRAYRAWLATVKPESWELLADECDGISVPCALLSLKERVKARRLQLGYSDAFKFCREHSFDPTTYTAIENGTIPMRRVFLEKLAFMLQISRKWLVTGLGELNEPTHWVDLSMIPPVVRQLVKQLLNAYKIPLPPLTDEK